MTVLTFTGKIDSSGGLIGPDAERMRPELRDHFAGEFVQIRVTGLAAYSDDLRAVYFAKIIPHVVRAMADAGYNVSPHDKNDLEATHDLMKLYFAPEEDGVPTTKGMSPEGWKIYIRKVEDWLITMFNYSIQEK